MSSMPTKWILSLNSHEMRDQLISTASVTAVVEIRLPLPQGLPAKILEAADEWSLSYSAISKSHQGVNHIWKFSCRGV